MNGRLIARATEEGYDVLLTVDKSMSYQNSPAPGSLAVLVIFAMDTRTDALAPRVSEILAGIESAPRGEFTILTLKPSEV